MVLKKGVQMSKRLIIVAFTLLMSLETINAMGQSFYTARTRLPQIARTAASRYGAALRPMPGLQSRFISQMSRQEAASTLGVENNATFEQIKAQYRKLAMQFHPDRSAESPERALAMMKKINEARDTLLKPKSFYESTRQESKQNYNRTYRSAEEQAQADLAALIAAELKRWAMRAALRLAAIGTLGYEIYKGLSNYRDKVLGKDELEKITQAKFEKLKAIPEREKFLSYSNIWDITHRRIDLITTPWLPEQEKWLVLCDLIQQAFTNNNDTAAKEYIHFIKAKALYELASLMNGYYGSKDSAAIKKLITKKLKEEKQTYMSKFGITAEQLEPENLFKALLELPEKDLNWWNAKTNAEKSLQKIQEDKRKRLALFDEVVVNM